MSNDPDDVSEVHVETEEEFAELHARQLHELIAEHERKAAETGQIQEFGFRIAQEGPLVPAGSRTILEIMYVCEPGKPALQVSITRQDPINANDTDDC